MATETSTTASPGTVAARRTVPAPGRQPRRSRIGAAATGRLGWVFLAPFALVFVLFMVVPLLYALWLSLHGRSIMGGQRWVGFENYVRAFNDPEFLDGLRRVLVFGVIQVPTMIIFALVLALIIDAVVTRLSRTARLVAFMPYAVPAVIGALMWGFLYNPQLGPAGILDSMLGSAAPDLMGRQWVLYSLMNVVTWQMTGYNMIIIYAALQGLPREIYEAGRIDGANGWQIATRIKVPLVAPALVLSTIFTIIGTLQFFTEAKIMQATRPDSVPQNFTPNMYAYNMAFAYGQFNYAAAISFALGAVVFIGSYVFLFLTRRRSGLNDD